MFHWCDISFQATPNVLRFRILTVRYDPSLRLTKHARVLQWSYVRKVLIIVWIFSIILVVGESSICNGMMYVNGSMSCHVISFPYVSFVCSFSCSAKIAYFDIYQYVATISSILLNVLNAHMIGCVYWCHAISLFQSCS